MHKKSSSNVYKNKEDFNLIPKIIHRTIPQQTTKLMDMCWDSVIKNTPDFYHMTHYDIDIFPIVGEYLEMCPKGAFKADLIRLEVLYRYGGVYLDSDVELYKPINDLLKHELFICKQDNEHVVNAIIGSVPENPLILDMINMSIDIIKKGYLVPPYLFMDPRYSDIYSAAFGPYVSHICTLGKDNVEFLDSPSFDIYWHKKNTGGIYGRHHCANSWGK